MFTGLVQETGEIADLRRIKARNGDVLTRITVAAKAVPKELQLGDSVAVSGVCLTAVEIGRKKFSADLAEETLKRTSLSRLKKKSLVNLELPARPQDRLGGHIVQGHVDGTGTLASMAKVQGRDDWRLVIDMPADLAKYVVAQGSITYFARSAGISMTSRQSSLPWTFAMLARVPVPSTWPCTMCPPRRSCGRAGNSRLTSDFFFRRLSDVRFKVSSARSAENFLRPISTAVRHTPLTATLSPSCNSLGTPLAATVIRVRTSPLRAFIRRRSAISPVSCTKPVNIRLSPFHLLQAFPQAAVRIQAHPEHRDHAGNLPRQSLRRSGAGKYSSPWPRHSCY